MGLRCRADFSDVDVFFREGMSDVKEVMSEVGESAVEYAKTNGNYQDHTGHLRNSNKCKVDSDKLTVYNDAESPKGHHYAVNVESKGYDVLSGAALHAEAELKAKFEK